MFPRLYAATIGAVAGFALVCVAALGCAQQVDAESEACRSVYLASDEFNRAIAPTYADATLYVDRLRDARDLAKEGGAEELASNLTSLLLTRYSGRSPDRIIEHIDEICS